MIFTLLGSCAMTGDFWGVLFYFSFFLLIGRYRQNSSVWKGLLETCSPASSPNQV